MAQWQFRDFTAAEGTQAAVDFLNQSPAQAQGETSAAARNNGSVGMFYLAPGTGDTDNKQWQFRSFTAAEGAQAAVDFLNQSPAQARGEASALARNDGSVGVFYLAPGTGDNDNQQWQFRDFSTAEGVKTAVDFLNQSPAQARGEASAFARNDGSVGVFYLAPGTGDNDNQQWQFRDFTAAEGAQAAVDFLNQSPAQAAGEACAFARADGSVGVLYLAPGTG